jgi:hypothetical protein
MVPSMHAGVSEEKGWDMNSLCVPRVAKESIGALCRLRHRSGTCMTVNVEYNQLDPLLRNTINVNGIKPLPRPLPCICPDKHHAHVDLCWALAFSSLSQSP